MPRVARLKPHAAGNTRKFAVSRAVSWPGGAKNNFGQFLPVYFIRGRPSLILRGCSPIFVVGAFPE